MGGGGPLILKSRGKKSSPTKCQCQSESSLRCRYLENEKRMIRIKDLRFVDCALRYS